MSCYTLLNDIDFFECKLKEKLYDLKLLFKNADKSRGGGQNLQDLEDGGCLDDSGESEGSQRFRVMAVKKNSNTVAITSDILSDKDLEEVDALEGEIQEMKEESLSGVHIEAPASPTEEAKGEGGKKEWNSTRDLILQDWSHYSGGVDEEETGGLEKSGHKIKSFEEIEKATSHGGSGDPKMKVRFPYVCNVCNKKFLKIERVQEHLVTHRSRRKYKCQNCSASFSILSELKAHTCSTQSEEKELEGEEEQEGEVDSKRRRRDLVLCELCGAQVQTLTSHMRTAHGIGQEHRSRPTCPVDTCCKVMSSAEELADHMQDLHGDLHVPCERCNCFIFSSCMELHLEMCSGEVPKSGKRGPKKRQSGTSTSLNGLDRHERDIQFCPICCRKVKNRYWLEIHIQNIHNTPRPYQCGECGVSYQKVQQLELHMLSHTGDTPFRCDLCGKGLANASSLKKHRALHLGRQTKPYECEICCKRFSGRDNLNVHLRGVHSNTEDLRYICDVCGKKFPILGWLKNHLRTHSDARPFQCSYCSKCFKEYAKLRVHERIHTGERPYVCSLCREGFIRSESLKKHMFKDHGIDTNEIAFVVVEDQKVHLKGQSTVPATSPGGVVTGHDVEMSDVHPVNYSSKTNKLNEVELDQDTSVTDV
ncbi:unnamed protein product [Darwinula stevensoni]|uniref:C2H2-type domain-containing protein n=1 Tax=Darwinula stevensoni TaxID=69355 RepID=A0A7R8XDS1_9CRUS|nr:unnamed protein product [Darwinula stevensoni]CAG0894598.1 unnamed protein product [Darwinula stevensoni]